MPDSKIVETRKFTNNNNRTAPKINGASEMRGISGRNICGNNDRSLQH